MLTSAAWLPLALILLLFFLLFLLSFPLSTFLAPSSLSLFSPRHASLYPWACHLVRLGGCGSRRIPWSRAVDSLH